jgi:hypothetical protein
LVPRLFACCALFLFGCRAAHDVVTSPVRLFHHPTPTPIPSTTIVATTESDERASGRPQASPASTPPHRPTHYVTTSSPSPSPAKSKQATTQATPKQKPVTNGQTTSPEQDFPTARPVPEKPGYVYSLSDPSKYVDVSGYAPGSKVKDPYSGKIFVVP